MSAEKELAELVLEKSRLRARVDEINVEIRVLVAGVDLPFCVEVDGYAVMVKKGQYGSGLPQVTTARLLL